MPSLSNWVAPTLNVEELDKRIAELKAVHFWLDQNGKALAATIQALEVQKMTLATLQGMNFKMGDVANALKLKTAETMAGAAQKASAAVEAFGEAAGASARKAAGKSARPAAGDGDARSGAVDPLQWWGALTHQFQEIAANAMKDVAHKAAVDTGGDAAAAVNTAGKTARKKPAKKAAPRKPRAKP
jgi:hypothetical protein